jgi:hypothetical protein
MELIGFTYPVAFPRSRYRDISGGLKRPGREASHLPSFSAEIKNAWSRTSTLPIYLHGGVLT